MRGRAEGQAFADPGATTPIGAEASFVIEIEMRNVFRSLRICRVLPSLIRNPWMEHPISAILDYILR
jgi:hypothetical protein